MVAGAPGAGGEEPSRRGLSSALPWRRPEGGRCGGAAGREEGAGAGRGAPRAGKGWPPGGTWGSVRGRAASPLPWGPRRRPGRVAEGAGPLVPRDGSSRLAVGTPWSAVLGRAWPLALSRASP